MNITEQPLMINIDFSANNLSGEIPQEITHLFGLKNQNLSGTYFTGPIPERIGDLRWMGSLDLSRNKLSGVIPQSLSSLTSLNHLNLSYNNLSGENPSGNQLKTLDDPLIHTGNPDLCGAPLPNKCPKDGTNHSPQPVVGDAESKGGIEILIFYSSMGFGFVVGFWVVCGILLLKKSWRISYYPSLTTWEIGYAWKQ